MPLAGDIPGNDKLLEDLFTHLLDFLWLQYLDEQWNWMACGPGLPGKDPPAVRNRDACLSIRLLGDDNCRTVKEGNVRRKDRHGKAAFPRLVSCIVISHSCPLLLLTDQAQERPDAGGAALGTETAD
jgi:hypothetical protein